MSMCAHNETELLYIMKPWSTLYGRLFLGLSVWKMKSSLPVLQSLSLHPNPSHSPVAKNKANYQVPVDYRSLQAPSYHQGECEVLNRFGFSQTSTHRQL